MRTIRTGLPTEEDIRGRARMEMAQKVAETEDDVIHIIRRLAVIGSQLDALAGILVPPALLQLRADLEQMRADITTAAVKLQADREAHERKVEADREKLARLALEKLET